jgi:hypothetical protein
MSGMHAAFPVARWWPVLADWVLVAARAPVIQMSRSPSGLRLRPARASLMFSKRLQ